MALPDFFEGNFLTQFSTEEMNSTIATIVFNFLKSDLIQLSNIKNKIK